MSAVQLGFWDDGISLREARERFLSELDEGTTCPCCDRHAQRYRWTLPATAVRFLLRNYRAGGTTMFVESKQLKRPGEQAMPSICRFWGLLEEEPERRPDGGKSGWWRVTLEGERFIHGGSIPLHAYVYRGGVERYDGPPQTISDRLGHPFDWRKHMRGESD